ncbi:MBL fold metallo-hydrolase [Vreelandella populi]|uniref:MBL fold metallo-hydrolase n=1 Tax=Vreelandella populi TaxID=2498858 RepID=UPI000F8C4206|nr:MBL fold metallo-hydrolase [Halomonas populi]RUR52868.1 MBL fold metallo-hydrolase [Halomonas populi]
MKTFARSASTGQGMPEVAGFFDPRTFSVQYIISDPTTQKCAIIDPVLDFDEKSGATATHHADELLAYVAKHDLSVEWVLDTHPHADHFSAAQYLKEKTGAPTAIGEHITKVQALWKEIYHWPETPTDGRQWDRLFAAGDTFKIGELSARVLHSPGHTLASISYVVGDAAFIHDTLFQPDFGTARADFPGGDAQALWHSIKQILALPGSTRLFTGHDYMPDGREPSWESSVAEQRERNLHLAGKRKADYIALRQQRDSELPMPKLMLHALQVNIQGGRLPEPEVNGKRYLKIPLDALKGAKWG